MVKKLIVVCVVLFVVALCYQIFAEAQRHRVKTASSGAGVVPGK